ncbi:MAG: DNA internalization-related competence protein ComEC/Rec2 [Gammaproteobacteria bacterium]|nr:DNA internalization-related competence protein ComEC/Rec2 [Gammaproteobacteria bacterium]
MLLLAASFALGTLAFHQLAELPQGYWLLPGAAIAALCWFFLRSRILLALVTGFCWSHAYSLLTVPPPVPGQLPTMRMVLSGQVVSLIERKDRSARFVFAANSIESLGETLDGDWRIRLSWQDAPDLHPGDAWRFAVRVRAAHGYASPGAWDYEGWLYWQGIRYAGYVSADGPAQALDRSPCCFLHRWRDAISIVIDQSPVSAFSRGVVRAIGIGDTSGLDGDVRALFRATGTSHLMAISGLHIGLIASLGLVGFSGLWRCLPTLCGRIPARVVGAGAGLVLAFGYALMAGMGLPTQRALIMLSLLALGLLLRREGNSLNALAVAALAVLSWHPPSIIAAGFWLSFGAVLIILAALRHATGRPWWMQALVVQLALGVALLPVLTFFDLPVSLVAPLVNLLLVPLFGFVVVPISLAVALAAGISADTAGWMLHYLAVLLDSVHDTLVWIVAQPWPRLEAPHGSLFPSLTIALAAALLLSPPGVPLRGIAVPLLAVLWLPRQLEVTERDFHLHLLDVGQGLSTVVLTRHHTLIFDSGPEFSSGFSTAQAVVAPFLMTHGRRRVDRLVLSHGDKDHAGGVAQLLSTLDVVRVVSGEPRRVGHGALPCIAGERWQWDGVQFEFLHPNAGHAFSGNDASCVLRISNAAGSVLLTGDIEQRVERQLLGNRGLHSDIVVAPHHGSRSSSAATFIAATQPRYVLYSAGWANRYGFPATEVQARWFAAGAQAINTATSGTIGFVFSDAEGLSVPRQHRRVHRRFWWHDSGSAEAPLAVSSGD